MNEPKFQFYRIKNKVDTVLLMSHAIHSDSFIQLFWQFQVVFDLKCKNSSDMQQEKIAFKHLTQIDTFTIMKYFICLILYMKQAIRLVINEGVYQ